MPAPTCLPGLDSIWHLSRDHKFHLLSSRALICAVTMRIVVPCLATVSSSLWLFQMTAELDFTHHNSPSSGLAAGWAKQAVDFSHILRSTRHSKSPSAPADTGPAACINEPLTCVKSSLARSISQLSLLPVRKSALKSECAHRQAARHALPIAAGHRAWFPNRFATRIRLLPGGGQVSHPALTDCPLRQMSVFTRNPISRVKIDLRDFRSCAVQ